MPIFGNDVLQNELTEDVMDSLRKQLLRNGFAYDEGNWTIETLYLSDEISKDFRRAVAKFFECADRWIASFGAGRSGNAVHTLTACLMAAGDGLDRDLRLEGRLPISLRQLAIEEATAGAELLHGSGNEEAVEAFRRFAADVDNYEGVPTLIGNNEEYLLPTLRPRSPATLDRERDEIFVEIGQVLGAREASVIAYRASAEATGDLYRAKESAGRCGAMSEWPDGYGYAVFYAERHAKHLADLNDQARRKFDRMRACFIERYPSFAPLLEEKLRRQVVPTSIEERHFDQRSSQAALDSHATFRNGGFGV